MSKLDDFLKNKYYEKYKLITIDDLHQYSFNFEGLIEFEVFINKLESFYSDTLFVEVIQVGTSLLSYEKEFRKRVFKDKANNRFFFLSYPDGPQIGMFYEIENIEYQCYQLGDILDNSIELSNTTISAVLGEYDGRQWNINHAIGWLDGKHVIANYKKHSIDKVYEILDFEYIFTYDIVD